MKVYLTAKEFQHKKLRFSQITKQSTQTDLSRIDLEFSLLSLRIKDLEYDLIFEFQG